MFKKTSQTARSVSGPPPADEATRPDPFRQSRVKEHKRSVLSPAISLNGDISGDEDLLLDGNMEGSISLPENEVLIGPEGRVKADVTAAKVSVEGRLTGDIKSSERVVIKPSGRVEGNIVAPRVVLEDGCRFKGSVEMNVDSESSGQPPRAAPESKSQDGAPASGTNAPQSKGTTTDASRPSAREGKSRAAGGS